VINKKHAQINAPLQNLKSSLMAYCNSQMQVDVRFELYLKIDTMLQSELVIAIFSVMADW
jgi:hypothetical protein